MNIIFIFFIFFSRIFSQNLDLINNSPINILGKIKPKVKKLNIPNSFDSTWVDSLSLHLPCKGIPVPKRASRLPNAPRDYRSGTHRGIDFFANWGTPVRAIASGSVIRADHYYKEYPPEYRVNLLTASSRVGSTPSDIFNSVLLGKAVFLDHGFEIIPGFRVISIYAHLSSIDTSLTIGKYLEAGDNIGKTGNTGTRASTLGTKKESHLHWEMILQKGKNEIFLGQDMSNPELYNMLDKIFKP